MSETNLARNTGFFTLAFVLQKVISLGYFTFLARWLGPEDIGRYTFALSFTTLFAVLVDAGFSSLLIREVARDRTNADKLLPTVLGVKAVLAAATIGLVALAINALGYPALTRELVYLASIVMTLDSFTLVFYCLFRGEHNLRFESVGIIAVQLLVAVVGVAAVLWNRGELHWLVGAVLAGSAANFLYSGSLAFRRFRSAFKPRWDWAAVRNLLLVSLPFFLSGVFARVYNSLDTVLLSKLAGDAAVGQYSIGYKITFAWQFIPAAFAAALYPTLSHHHRLAELDATERARLADVYLRAFRYLAIVALPIAVGIGLLAHRLVPWLYGEPFRPAIPALQILIASVVFIFLNYPVGSLLNATLRQTLNTKLLATTLASNVILNLLLIPRYSFVGAAWAALLSNALLFSLGFWFTRDVFAGQWRNLWFIVCQVAVSAVALAVAMVVLREQGIIPTVALGSAVYITALWLVRGWTVNEVSGLLGKLFRRGEY